VVRTRGRGEDGKVVRSGGGGRGPPRGGHAKTEIKEQGNYLHILFGGRRLAANDIKKKRLVGKTTRGRVKKHPQGGSPVQGFTGSNKPTRKSRNNGVEGVGRGRMTKTRGETGKLKGEACSKGKKFPTGAQAPHPKRGKKYRTFV